MVIYAAFTYSFYAAGLTLIALLQDTIFSAAPYNLTSSSIGLTNLPLFGVGLIGTLLSGYTADFVVSFLTRHNAGVYEPEFRLPVLRRLHWLRLPPRRGSPYLHSHCILGSADI